MHLTMSIAHPYSRHQTLVPPTSRITCPLPMVVPGLLPPIPLGTQSSLSSRPANTTTTSMKVGSTDRNLWRSSWEIDINDHHASKPKLIAIVKTLLLQPCLSLVVMVSLANGSTVKVNKNLIIDTMLQEMKMILMLLTFFDVFKTIVAHVQPSVPRTPRLQHPWLHQCE